jgi:hypothetical protein
VIAGERTLREIYYRGFEIAVKESSPRTIMTSYNRINGIYTSEDKNLLTEILRYQWKFDGLVMTDWFGGQNAPGQIRAGNDLLEPGESQEIKVIIPLENLASFVPETGWVVDSGEYTFRIGSSSRDIRQEIRLPGIPEWIVPLHAPLPWPESRLLPR